MSDMVVPDGRVADGLAQIEQALRANAYPKSKQGQAGLQSKPGVALLHVSAEIDLAEEKRGIL